MTTISDQDVARNGSVNEHPGDGLGVFGQLSQMTGWLALDANRHGAARRYLSTAVYAAHEADEPSLAASALAYMSLQDTYRGRISSALSLARTAFEVSDGSVTPLVSTMLATRSARAHAVAGNHKQVSVHCTRRAPPLIRHDAIQSRYGFPMSMRPNWPPKRVPVTLSFAWRDKHESHSSGPFGC